MKRRVAALLVALTLTAGVAAGCGGDDESSGSADSGAQGATQEAPQGAPARIEDFQTCLEEQGVELPDPGAGAPPSGGDMDEEAQKAFGACQDELPEGIGPGGGGAPPSFDQDGSAPDTQTQ